MRKIEFKIPISHSFNELNLEFDEQMVDIKIELTEGDHLFTSEAVHIGDYYQFKVYANIIFYYNYNTRLSKITIAGLDDDSDRGLRLHAFLENDRGFSYECSINDERRDKNMGRNFWSKAILLNPLIKKNMIAILKNGHEIITERLLEEPSIRQVLRTGKAPVITPDNFEDYRAMLVPQKKHDFELTLEHINELQFIINSIYVGKVTWAIDDNYANVISSTGDPIHDYGSWIKLWRDKCNNSQDPTICSSQDFVAGIYTQGFCGSTYVGGHVIIGSTPSKLNDDDPVYIYPICSRHNNWRNDHKYMTLKNYFTGVELKYRK